MRSNLPDERPIDALRYRAALQEARPRLGRFGATSVVLDTTASTNDVALDICATAIAKGDDADGTVVVAGAQTAGRGRRGHTWFSPPGAGLYVSVVTAPGRARCEPERAVGLLTLAAGVAIAEGIAAGTGVNCALKWPNDMYASGRKLAGILGEGAGGDLVVLGYGVNVATTAFPPELGDRATSLESETRAPVDAAAVLVETLAALSRRYDDLLAGRFDAILDAWRARAPFASGARVVWTTSGGPRAGVTAGIDERGALLVSVDGRVERIVAGEVAWL